MAKTRILIADDHALIRDGIRTLVSHNKTMDLVSEAKDGQQAMDHYYQYLPDIMILDISMPVKNGMEVSREILSKNPEAKIIILSMFDDEDYITQCLEIGVKGYVIKSESGSELEYAVKAVMDGKSYFSRQAQDVIFRKHTRSLVQKKKEETISLTKREVEIIQLIATGLTSQEMADKLFISPRTVETHRSNIMKKFNAKNAIELITKARNFKVI